MYMYDFVNDYEPWMLWVGIAIAAVLLSGFALYILIFLVRRSNDSGSNSGISDFASKGIENDSYKPGLAALDFSVNLPYFMMDNVVEQEELEEGKEESI
ncbi:MAG: hypothetical protein J5546_00680 [Lachnospiraceae bacterium]|nr:hypothetical protein [Lachnospiraceae bacterium]